MHAIQHLNKGYVLATPFEGTRVLNQSSGNSGKTDASVALREIVEFMTL